MTKTNPVLPSQPMTDREPDSFDITWRNGAYYVSIPNYQGGTVYTSEYVAFLKAKAAIYDACSAKIDCLSRGAVPLRDDGAERIRDLEGALRHYAQNYCEDWCKDSPPNAVFDDCGGCRARAVLQPKESAK
jgi:hypothetical protein